MAQFMMRPFIGNNLRFSRPVISHSAMCTPLSFVPIILAPLPSLREWSHGVGLLHVPVFLLWFMNGMDCCTLGINMG